MSTIAEFPLTAAELAQMGTDLVRIPGSWDEFWEVLEESENRVEYQNNEIILSMSYESKPYSKIASRFGYLFEGTFTGSSFDIFNANRPVYIAHCQEVFNPDASVVQASGDVFTYRPGMTAEMSPIVILEVLSPATRERDLKEKLPCYKLIPSIRQIIYAESTLPMIYLFEKNETENSWHKKILDEMDDSLVLNGTRVSLREIYGRINFDETATESV